jgi:hypothetical protein
MRGANVDRTFDLRWPTLAEAKHGLEFTEVPKNWVQKKGSVGEFLTAMYPENSEAGIHASNDRKNSLCGLPLPYAETVRSGRAEDVAAAVTCKFCQARLVNAGVLDADADIVGAYARDY